MFDVRGKLEEYQSRIVDAGGDVERIKIIAVTKGFGPEAVTAAVDAGLSDVGENYAQEAVVKHATVGNGPCWHFIGQLQRNKVRLLSPFVDVWQSVDNELLINEIAKRQPGANFMVQVNLSEDPSRGGCSWDEAPRLIDHGREVGLNALGLMTVGLLEGPEASRPAFRRLAKLAHSLELPEVSMGMSSDFEVAVQEGATMIRLGTALFGERRKN